MERLEGRTARIYTRTKHKGKAAACTLAAGMLFFVSPARAQGPDLWQFQATLYIYVPDIGGTTKFPPAVLNGARKRMPILPTRASSVCADTW